MRYAGLLEKMKRRFALKYKLSIHLSKNMIVISVLDILLLMAAFLMSHLLRFDFEWHKAAQYMPFKAIPLILLTKIICFHWFDLYRGMWRFASIRDLINVIKAATVASLLIITAILLTQRFAGFSRSVYVIDCGLTIFLVAGLRLFVRFFFELAGGLDGLGPKVSLGTTLRNILSKNRQSRKHLLIIGAGRCAEIICREIRSNRNLNYCIVGFLDDHPAKKGRKIHGAPVFGPIDLIARFTEKLRVDEILIAIPSAKGAEMRRIVDSCKQTGVPFKTVPGYGELINGQVLVHAIREVDYRDLLGREVVKLDGRLIAKTITGKVIMVTGAAGSIGSELCRQICQFNPDRLILFERAESPLYDLELALTKCFAGIKIQAVLGDILDEALLADTFTRYRPSMLFHAAAYKHVPMLELQPWQAVTNNIIGTRNVVKAAARFGVRRFVFVSTDKAVRPANVMGASKRVSEMLVQCHAHMAEHTTRFMIVRFGNVVGSVGSVVPLFKRQIAAGGPVTVTHPEVTRFFMTIPEASQLIMQAGAMGEGGEIFILEMGSPIKIADLARDLIRLSGFEPDADIPIKYVGLRPGEKLYEELITEGEGIVPTPHEKILVIRGTTCDLGRHNGRIDRLRQLAVEQDDHGIRAMLKQMVPEYAPCDPDGVALPAVGHVGGSSKVVPFPKSSAV